LKEIVYGEAINLLNKLNLSTTKLMNKYKHMIKSRQTQNLTGFLCTKKCPYKGTLEFKTY